MESWAFLLGATVLACALGAWILFGHKKNPIVLSGQIPQLRLRDVCIYAHAPLGPNVFRGSYRGAPIVVKRVKCADAADRTRRQALIQKHWELQNSPALVGCAVELLGYAVEDDPHTIWLDVFLRHAGTTLSHLLRAPLPPSLRVDILARAAQAIATLHHARISHGRLKGTNIFVDAEGSVRLADFGSPLDGVEESPPWWSPPEHVLSPSRAAASEAADAWSFGMVVFEAFARCAPWERDVQRSGRPLDAAGALAFLRSRLSRSPLELPLLPEDAWVSWPSGAARSLNALWQDCCRSPPLPWWTVWASSPPPRPSMTHVARSLRDILAAFPVEARAGVDVNAAAPSPLLLEHVQRIVLDAVVPSTFDLLRSAITQHARLTNLDMVRRFTDDWNREAEIMASPNYGELVFASAKVTRQPGSGGAVPIQSSRKSHVATLGVVLSLPLEGAFSEQEFAEVGKLAFALQVLRNRHALRDDARVHGVSSSYVEIDALQQRASVRLVSVSPNATYEHTEARKWREAMGGALPERETAHIIRELCLALRSAHAAGVLHRNINMGALYLHASQSQDLPEVVLSSWSFSCRIDDVSWFKGDVLPSMREAAAPEYVEFAQRGGRSRASSFRSCEVFQVAITAYHLLGGDLFSREPTSGTRRFGFPTLPKPSAALLEFLSLALNDDPAQRPSLEQLIASPWLTRRFGRSHSSVDDEHVILQHGFVIPRDLPDVHSAMPHPILRVAAGTGSLPPFSLLRMRDLTLIDVTIEQAFAGASNMGSYGRVVFADWQPPSPTTPANGSPPPPPPPPVRVALKAILGQSPGGDGGNTTYNAFVNETAILAVVRKAVDYLRVPSAASVLADARGRPIAAKAGLRLLCYTYCTGTEAEGARFVPTLQPVPLEGLGERPTPPGTPLYLIAMEPLVGGTLVERQRGDSPLSKTGDTPGSVLCAMADMFAALAALHSLGFAHSDIK